MTLIEALKISDHIRRKGKASHVGSNGNGWVDIYTLLLCNGLQYNQYSLTFTKEDILADDWEALEDK